MAVLFADTSALIRAYLQDEIDHDELRVMLFEPGHTVYMSEVAIVEGAAALALAQRSGRLTTDLAEALETLDGDLGGDGRITRVALEPAPTFARARQLVVAHKLRTLDAVHLAVADREGRQLAAPEPLTFVTRDADQRVAAEAIGLAVV